MSDQPMYSTVTKPRRLLPLAALAALGVAVVACADDGPPVAAPAAVAERVGSDAPPEPTDPSAGPATASTVAAVDNAPAGSDAAAGPATTAAHDGHAMDPAGPAYTGPATDPGVDASPPPAGPGVSAVSEPVLVLSRDNTFSPEVLEVPVGTEVVWRNGGRTEHDLYPVDASLDWGVAPEDFPPGATYSVVFTEPGEYPYYCTIHGTTTRGMVGTIIVTG